MEQAAAHLMTKQDNLPKKPAVRGIGFAGLPSLHAKSMGLSSKFDTPIKHHPQDPLDSLLSEAFCKWCPGDLNE